MISLASSSAFRPHEVTLPFARRLIRDLGPSGLVSISRLDNGQDVIRNAQRRGFSVSSVWKTVRMNSLIVKDRIAPQPHLLIGSLFHLNKKKKPEPNLSLQSPQ
jgi:hypothetical protein